jgi:hypothetical protein
MINGKPNEHFKLGWFIESGDQLHGYGQDSKHNGGSFGYFELGKL